MTTTTSAPPLPAFMEAIRRIYLRGEASMFILHENVHDRFLYDGGLHSLTDFLGDALLKNKDTVITYNVSQGLRFRKRHKDVTLNEALLTERTPADVLPRLEDILRVHKNVALVIEYADMVAPGGDPNFYSSDDRRAVVTLHRWSQSQTFERNDNMVLLVTETLAGLNSTLVANPKIAAVKLPLPSDPERAATVRFSDPRIDAPTVTRFAKLTAGLKNVQIHGILHVPPVSLSSLGDRKAFIEQLLAGSTDAGQRAEKLAQMTSGMSHDEIRKLVNPDAKTPVNEQAAPHAEEEKLILARKREILERECHGLIEFIEGRHGFEAVGGNEGIKKELRAIARAIHSGETNRVPMGMLFTGPMGTGKTFVAEAFCRESGLTAIKLKNFRSKWVGATEGNLERVLSVVKAIGEVVVIIDEGDRAFGSGEGEGDGGTSSRVIARLKEFMSDTSNRGRVLFILMTNRPDKLDLDLKRAGRLDRKIPFLYPQTPDEVEGVLLAQLKRHGVRHTIEFPRDRETVSQRLVGYSNADTEAVALLANDRTADESRAVTPEDLTRALDDYMPPKDATMLEYMELLAVFEASNRGLLPAKYQGVPVDELQARLRVLRAQVK